MADEASVSWLPPSLTEPVSLSCPLPPPNSYPRSPPCQGWIPAFISTIQPQCLLATEHGSFNCSSIPRFIQPVQTYNMPTAFHPRFVFLFPVNSPLGLFCWCFSCSTCLPGRPAALKAYQCHTWGQTDSQERLFCQDVSLQEPAGAHTHNQWGKTWLGPQSERPSQNQLALRLMKRVMKRVLSLLQTGREMIVNLCEEDTRWKGTSKIFK